MAEITSDPNLNLENDSAPQDRPKSPINQNGAEKSDSHQLEGTSDLGKTAPESQEHAAGVQDDASKLASGVETDNDVDIDENKQANAGSSEQDRNREGNASLRVQEAQRYNARKGQQSNKSQRGGDNDRGRKRKFQNRNKFDPRSLPESDDPIAIRKQVEFYFSDSNLFTDPFLFNKIEGHKNLPVPLDVIHSFKRMRHFQPRSAIVSALKESEVLDLVNDENDIQRKQPLPESVTGKPLEEIQKVHEDESMARTIYAKGFGSEEASTQFDIEAFFTNYGTTNSVRLRRADDSSFKGSVFVEFDNEETAKNFLAVEPKPSYKGNELLIKSKKQYCDDKVEDIKAGKIRPNSPGGQDRQRANRDLRQRKEARDLDKDDPRDWRERRDEDAKEGFPDRNKRDKRHGGKDFRGSNFRGRGRGRGRGGREGGDGRDRDGRSASPSHETKDPTAQAGADVLQQGSKDIGQASAANDTGMESEAIAASNGVQEDKSISGAKEESSNPVISIEAPFAGENSNENTKKRPLDTAEANSTEREAKKVDTGN